MKFDLFQRKDKSVIENTPLSVQESRSGLINQ